MSHEGNAQLKQAIIDLETALADFEYTFKKKGQRFFVMSKAKIPTLVSQENAEWVLEKYRETNVMCLNKNDFESLVHLMEWGIIMNPRPLEVAIMWANKKMEIGETVRIRNIKTGEVIPGEILCRERTNPYE